MSEMYNVPSEKRHVVLLRNLVFRHCEPRKRAFGPLRGEEALRRGNHTLLSV